MDKTIVDAIADPMTHLIRNSADHGIEKIDDRVKKGKKPYGTIHLNSYVKGNFVYIEISDDGAGIDKERIVKKAVEKGILPADKATTLSESRQLGLIFAPGFSTAEQVTDISGRGVGMDVVKSNINKLKGTVLIESEVGKGTTIQLRFPMSLVVLMSLVVRIRHTSCAVSLDQVDESIDYKKSEVFRDQQEPTSGDNSLSLYSLSELLWHTPQEEAGAYHVLRFKSKTGSQFGFIVDDFTSIEDALIQSVDSYIAAMPGVQGATIRKDGKVAIVLNVDSILELASMNHPMGYVRIREKNTNQSQALLSDFLNIGKA